jgi:hypothetical protein
MLGGVVGLAVTFGRIELEGDAEDGCGIAAEDEFPIEVPRVRRDARWRRVFVAFTEFVSGALAAEAEGG